MIIIICNTHSEMLILTDKLTSDLYLSLDVLKLLLLLLTMLLLSHPRRFVRHLGLLGVHHVHEDVDLPDPISLDPQLLQRLVRIVALDEPRTDDPVLRQFRNVKLLLNLECKSNNQARLIIY